MSGREVVRVASGLTLAPFGELVREALVGNVPLATQQERAAAGAGLRLVEAQAGWKAGAGGAWVMWDDVFVSRDALRAFVAAAPGEGGAVFALGASLFGRSNRPGQGNPQEEVDGATVDLFDVFWVPEGSALPEGTRAEATAALRHGARRVVIDPLEKVIKLPLPQRLADKEPLEFALAERPVLRVRHWMHLLRLNQLALGLRWSEQSKARLVLRALWAALRALSFNKHKVLGKLNTLGPGCDIHPTAVVEGSVLGAGCVIGPYARVQFSELGDKATVQGGSQVFLSILGSGAVVNRNVFVNFSVLYPEAITSSVFQLSIMGRGAMMATGSYMMDTHFGPPIKVVLDGELVSSENPFLGVALGHNTLIGSGIWLAAGRELPNDMKLVRDPALVASKLAPGDDLSVPMVVRNGTIVPM